MISLIGLSDCTGWVLDDNTSRFSDNSVKGFTFFGVLEVWTSRRCLSVVAWFLFSVGFTDLLLQLGNSSLEAILWVRGHVEASHHLLAWVVAVLLWHCGAVSRMGVYYHRWSCQCKKLLFARVTHLLKLLDAIVVCFRLAISFRQRRVSDGCVVRQGMLTAFVYCAIAVCARHLFVGWFWFRFRCCFWCRVPSL